MKTNKLLLRIVVAGLASLILVAGIYSWQHDSTPPSEPERPNNPAPNFDTSQLRQRVLDLLEHPPHVGEPVQHLLAKQILDGTDPDTARALLVAVATELEADGKVRSLEEFAADLKARRQRAAIRITGVSPELLDAPYFRDRFPTSVSIDGKGLVADQQFPSAKGLHTLLAHIGNGQRILDSQRLALLLAQHTRSLAPVDAARLRKKIDAALASGQANTLDGLLERVGLSRSDLGLDDSDDVPLSSAVEKDYRTALKRDADRNRRELETILSNRKKLDAHLAKIVEATESAWQEVEFRNSAIRLDLKELSDDVDPTSNHAGDKATSEFLHRRMRNADDADKELALLDKKEGPYAEMSDDQRGRAKKILETQVRNKRLERLEKCSSAVEVFSHGVELLHNLKLIDAKAHNDLQQGAQAMNYALQVATAVVARDPFAAVSGGIQFINVLLGNDPPPDPAAIRHEQVMDMLDHLAKGQQTILDSLVQLSEQINTQYLQLHDNIDEVRRIALNTQQLVLERQIDGLNRAQWMIAGRKDHNGGHGPSAVAIRDYSTYDALRDHFLDTSNVGVGKGFYQDAVRFLDAQTKGRPTALVQYADADGEMKNAADALERRMKKLLAFVETYVKDEYHAALLGSLVHPEASVTGLDAKLDRILAENDPVAKHWADTTQRLGLRHALGEYYNPEIVERIVHAQLELHPYSSLLDRRTGKPAVWNALLAKDRAPLGFYSGDAYSNRLTQHLEPLRNTRDLQSKAIAQNALLTGDVLVPIFSHLVVSSRGERDDQRKIRDDARSILAENPVIHENAVRYHLASRLDVEGDTLAESQAKWTRIHRLLKEETSGFPAKPRVAFRPMTPQLREYYDSIVELPANKMSSKDEYNRYLSARSARDSKARALRRAKKKHEDVTAVVTQRKKELDKANEYPSNILNPSGVRIATMHYTSALAAASQTKKAYDKALRNYRHADYNLRTWTNRTRLYRNLCEALDVAPSRIHHVKRTETTKRAVVVFKESKNLVRTPLLRLEQFDSGELHRPERLESLLRSESRLETQMMETVLTFANADSTALADQQFRRERLLRVLFATANAPR